MSQEPIVEKPRKKRKKRPPHKSKMITGYIIYASEIRKDVIKKYPDRDFGDISKLVGIEWKNLSQETKVAYEKRAQEQNAKSKAITAEAFELKKLADAAEERAREQQQSQTLQQPQQILHRTDATTVQYNCNNVNNATTNGTSSPVPTIHHHTGQLHQTSSPSPICSTPQAQFQKSNIIYRTPLTLRAKPKDASTQSEPIKWVQTEPRDRPKFSKKFIDYLSENRSVIMAKLDSSD